MVLELVVGALVVGALVVEDLVVGDLEVSVAFVVLGLGVVVTLMVVLGFRVVDGVLTMEEVVGLGVEAVEAGEDKVD